MEISIEKEDIKIEYTRDLIHGDFASNIAMLLAKKNKCNPRELANKISENPVSYTHLTLPTKA